MLTRPMLSIQILITNYDIITDFLNLAICSEHFISIKHRRLATFNIKKKSILTACVPLRRKSKDWSAWNQNKVSEWSVISTGRQLFQ